MGLWAPISMEPTSGRTTPTPENVRFRVGLDPHQLNAYVCRRACPCQSQHRNVYPHPVRWVQSPPLSLYKTRLYRTLILDLSLHSHGRADNQRPWVSGGFTRATRLDVRRTGHTSAPLKSGWVHLIGNQIIKKRMPAIHIRWVQSGYRGPKTKKALTTFCRKCLFLLVELRGIEPLTS